MSYPLEVGASPTGDSDRKREAVLRVMSAAAFLIFFQAYLDAPLIPALIENIRLPLAAMTCAANEVDFGSDGRFCVTPASQEVAGKGGRFQQGTTGGLMSENEPFVDPNRAAEFLSITRRRVLEMARSGEIPAHALGEGKRKMWRFRFSELAEAICRQKASR